jgi:hypothetical protein
MSVDYLSGNRQRGVHFGAACLNGLFSIPNFYLTYFFHYF